MNKQVRRSLKTFLLELLVYAVLVVGYYFLVLHLMGDWLNRLFHQHRQTYAGVALALILGQGLLLDSVTSLLLAWVKPRSEEE